MIHSVNKETWKVFQEIWPDCPGLGCSARKMDCGAWVIDAGVNAPGGFSAGLRMAELSTAGRAQAKIIQGSVNGIPWPTVHCHSEEPRLACFLSQAANWPIQLTGGFSMGSGPACLLGAADKVPGLDFEDDSDCAVLILEGSFLPGEEDCRSIAAACKINPGKLGIMIAPTASMACVVQIAARSIEIAMHKLHRLEFDLGNVVSGLGCCPVATPGGTDCEALGKTNDAMMFAAQVWLSVNADDSVLESLVNTIPASTSQGYGKPFLETLAAAGGFYGVDPDIFAPAEITLVNLKSGRVFHAGQRDEARLAAALLSK